MNHWLESLENRTLFAAVPADVARDFADIKSDDGSIAQAIQAAAVGRIAADRTIRADIKALGPSRELLAVYARATANGLKAQAETGEVADFFETAARATARKLESADATEAARATAVSIRIKSTDQAALERVLGQQFASFNQDLAAAPALDNAALADLGAIIGSDTRASTSRLDADLGMIAATRDVLIASEAAALAKTQQAILNLLSD